MPASSELCTNHSAARIRDLLWFSECNRGVTICPKQNIHLAPWITFPTTSNYIPFVFDPYDNRELFSDTQLNVYLLIETDVIPSMMMSEKSMIMVGALNVTSSRNRKISFFFIYFSHGAFQVEQFGKLIAWKVDSRLSVLLHSNEKLFANLVVNTFLRNFFLINNKLTLTRIQCECLSWVSAGSFLSFNNFFCSRYREWYTSTIRLR